MKERYCEPFLPKNKVKRAFVSELMPEELINELKCMMIKPYKLGKSRNMSGELAYHPDILVNNIRKGMWICESNAAYLPKELPRDLFIESETELSNLYPYDCPFNNFRLGHALICGKSADYLIKAYADYEERLIVFVKQNYTKCCTVIVNERAVITSDISIGKTMRRHGFDVLTIEDSVQIGLNGYSYGLIGGCAGKISDDTIAFTGNLNTYRYGEDIRAFCNNHNVYALSLTNNPMYDYGGILPITEIVSDTSNTNEDVSEMFLQSAIYNYKKTP